VLPSTAQKTIGLRVLFTATLLNPKAILFAGTIFPAAAFENLAAYLEAMAIFTALLVPIGLAWIAFGAELASGRLMRISPVHVQRCASIILAAFSLSLAWAALH
jgi:threonine/homoserine/homoserine lactone efflux protein